MRVKLLSHTPNPGQLIGIATHSCRTQKGASELKADDEELKKLIAREVERGHGSILEHAKFTFSIEGISRVCTHQLVRHRMASYSQQSMRYVKIKTPDYVTPPKIEGEALSKFEGIMDTTRKVYSELLDSGVPEEDARFVLPHAVKTNIVVTMNARSLLNFFELRCCLHAQWEIREVANRMMSKVREIAPSIFKNAGPACVKRGECPEKDPDCPLYPKDLLNREE